MRLIGKHPRLYVLRLAAGVLVPLIALTGVAEQVCLCTDEGEHAAGDEHARHEHQAQGHDVGDHEDGDVVRGHQHPSEAGHGDCKCVGMDVTLAELSQPVHVGGKAVQGFLHVPPPHRRLPLELAGGGLARARAARSEQPPPLFLTNCSWLC